MTAELYQQGPGGEPQTRRMVDAYRGICGILKHCPPAGESQFKFARHLGVCCEQA